jgi:hypothetical protein
MHQLLLFVGTKLPIAMVGPQIILAMGENSRSRQSKRRCILQSSMVAGSGGRRAWALTKDPIKIERPAENDSADERPNKCAEPSISRLVADNDAEPSTSYSRD